MLNSHSMQAPGAVVMVLPHWFTPNPETEADNAFQTGASNGQREAVAKTAYDEVAAMIERLRDEGVHVHVFEDTGKLTPDSVFPNNWFSTHLAGQVVIYPMYPPSRRGERRADVIEVLKADYRVMEVTDYSGLEQDHLFLEGTGAMVLDHLGRVAYMARSNRANPLVLERFCERFGFEPMVFDAVDADGTPIYHTNVMMGVATEFALVGMETITEDRRAEVRARLEASGREVIELSHEQIAQFAGNAIELSGRGSRILALSQTAFDSLTGAQKASIERSARLVPISVPTIEQAGGSVRCMVAGIHLSRRA